MNFIGESLCVHKLLYDMRYFGDIWYICISDQNGVSHARMVTPLCCSFEISLFNEFYREKLVRFITIIPFEIFL